MFPEFKRRDVKPGEEAKVINLIAESCNMSYGRTRYAAQSLFKKGYLYNLEDEKEPDEIRMREILRNLLLNDPEIKELLKMGIVEERKQKYPFFLIFAFSCTSLIKLKNIVNNHKK